jgi:hypothetical protein
MCFGKLWLERSSTSNTLLRLFTQVSEVTAKASDQHADNQHKVGLQLWQTDIQGGSKV